MNDLELLLEGEWLRGTVGVVSALVIQGRSDEADEWALEQRVADRLAAYRAAGGVL